MKLAVSQNVKELKMGCCLVLNGNLVILVKGILVILVISTAFKTHQCLLKEFLLGITTKSIRAIPIKTSALYNHCGDSSFRQ